MRHAIRARHGRLLPVGVALAGLTLVWMVVAGRWSPDELAPAVAAAVAAVVVARRVRRNPNRLFAMRWHRFWAGAAIAFAQSFRDLRVVAAAVCRACAGGPRAAGTLRRFDLPRLSWTGSEFSRRAVAVTLASLAPNRFVTTIDPAAGCLTVHELVHQAGPAVPGTRS
jgi:hypothetical protein